VTITESDEETFQSQISEFHAQHFADQCYPAAVKNIIDELAERKNKPEMIQSLSEVNDICGYKPGLRCEEELIQPRLTQKLSQYGYEAVQKRAPEMDWEKLEGVIQNEQTSLPIIELTGRYFGEVLDYDGQPSTDGYSPHVVVPLKINTTEVLYYDPYENYFEKRPGIDEAPY
jgi:hypothetical protein